MFHPGFYLLINRAIKTRLAIFAALCTLLTSAGSQVEVTKPAVETTSAQTRTHLREDYPGAERRRRDNTSERKQDPQPRGEGHRHSSSEFRKLMQAELANLPALNNRMNRLMEIQARRHELQEKRQKVAVDNDGYREATVKKFHSLLRRDLQLAEESRGIVHQIVNDMPRIQKQLNRRRATLKTEVDNAGTSATATDSPSPHVRELRRRMRYLDFLEKKLGDLKTHPERLDLLARVLRGLPPDEASGSTVRPPRKSGESTTQTSLARLRDKRKALQRELRQVETRIDDLRGSTSRKSIEFSPGSNNQE